MLIYPFMFAVLLAAWFFLRPDHKTPLAGGGEGLWHPLEGGRSAGWKNFKGFRRGNPGQGKLLKEWALKVRADSLSGMSPPQQQALQEFKTWISNLPEAQADAIAMDIEKFCARQGIKLDYILSDEDLADIRIALTALVVYYGMAVRHRMAAQPLAALRAWEQDPMSKSNREFGIRLYTHYLEQGRICLPADFFLASEQKRSGFIVSALKEEIAKDPSAALSFAEYVLHQAPASDSAPGD